LNPGARLNPGPAFPETSAAKAYFLTTNRAAWGFGMGATTALLVMAVLPRFLFGFLSTTLPATQPFLPAANQLGLLLAFFADGAIGGFRLGISRRATWAYAFGFLVGGVFISQVFTYIRFLSGGRGPLEALFYCAAMGALGFGTAGAVGGLGLGRSKGLVLRSSAWFAVGGALGGVLLVSPFLVPYPGNIQLEQLLTMTCTLMGFLIPHLVGGAAIGSALQSERDR
jgi:hypothetical protein